MKKVIELEAHYRCSYERDIYKIIWVHNGRTECAFEVTPLFHRLHLVHTTANKCELVTFKAKAKEYLKELTKNHLL